MRQRPSPEEACLDCNGQGVLGLMSDHCHRCPSCGGSGFGSPTMQKVRELEQRLQRLEQRLPTVPEDENVS